MKANQTHAERLHLLRGTMRAFCHGRLVSKQGTEPCGRCETVRAREQARDAAKLKREELRAARQRDLRAGVLWRNYAGFYCLRYMLNNSIYCHSLHEREERRAKMLVPLLMHQIQRTGRPFIDNPKCNADTR